MARQGEIQTKISEIKIIALNKDLKMKHLLFGLAVIIVFYSCNNSNNKIKLQRDAEALKIKAIEQSRIDSLKLVRVDSLASIAWGDANFGMSFNEENRNI